MLQQSGDTMGRIGIAVVWLAHCTKWQKSAELDTCGGGWGRAAVSLSRHDALSTLCGIGSLHLKVNA